MMPMNAPAASPQSDHVAYAAIAPIRSLDCSAATIGPTIAKTTRPMISTTEPAYT